MASPVEAQLILCDAAQADPTGKVHMLGAGWSIIRGSGPHAVAVLVKVPWDRTNETLPLHLILQDADGQPVEVPTTEGPQRIENHGSIEVGRPVGLPPGITLNASFALNVPALPLVPGRYTWRLDFAGDTKTESFTVLE
jgi:hypothetical protein